MVFMVSHGHLPPLAHTKDTFNNRICLKAVGVPPPLILSSLPMTFRTGGLQLETGDAPATEYKNTNHVVRINSDIVSVPN